MHVSHRSNELLLGGDEVEREVGWDSAPGGFSGARHDGTTQEAFP
jgi:hypothetical protein